MYITNSKLIRDKLSFFRYQYFILFSLLFFVASFSLSAQTQLGSDIDGLLGTSNITPFGESTGDGATVSLSSDGTTVAIVILEVMHLVKVGHEFLDGMVRIGHS
jgi:hypothetical protein